MSQPAARASLLSIFRQLLACCLLCMGAWANATEGDLDATFNSGTGANSTIRDIAFQPDGKAIIGGYFTSVSGSSRNFIARINIDGSLTGSFGAGSSGPNYNVDALAVQPDGKVIIGGAFTSVGEVARNRIARLNGDGSLDTSFNPGVGPNSGVDAIALLDDGKLLIGGAFQTVNGVSRKGIARLNSDGSLDPLFDAAGSYVTAESIFVQSDGRLVLGGFFTTTYGAARNRIARLNADGSVDSTFNPGSGANDSVLSVVVQPDGKILLGGNFTTINGVARNRIARLNSDGSLDSGFDPGAGVDNAVMAIKLQADGQIVIGGLFNSVNGVARKGVARLNSNGAADVAFNAGSGANNGAAISAMAMQGDGKLVIGGSFSSYNDTAMIRAARIHTGDDDSDGIENAADVFPLDSASAGDSDADGIDAVVDNCLSYSNADQLNTDSDSQGDVCDDDDDNDGMPDISDSFPLDNMQAGDVDGDGIESLLDNCPYTVNADQLNTDGDAQGNICDSDDDNDGMPDISDSFPLDNTKAGDVDSDGIESLLDNCPYTVNADQLNTDNDAQGNACDGDDDNDGVADASDKFPLNVAASSDTDADGFPNSWNAACDVNCQTNSGLTLDNCPSNANVDQLNTDGDAQGDACDNDDDNDNVVDSSDIYPLNSLYSADVDRDTLPDNWELAHGRNPAKADYAVSTNATHACAIDEAGVKCWGDNTNGKLNVPTTLVHPYAVTTGSNWSCACDDNGSQCWGSGYPATPSCAVSTAGAIATVVFDGPGGCGSQAQTYPPGYFVQSTCGINSSGDVACDTTGTLKTYPIISVVNFYTCNWTTYSITGEDKLFTPGHARQLSQSNKRLCMLGDQGIQCNALSATTVGHPVTNISATDFTLTSLFIDSDGDGVPRPIDANDLDASVSGDTDSDSDGVDNNADLDDDGDNVPDYIDAEPLNPSNDNEMLLPVNSNYKGSSMSESAVVQ